MKLCKLRVRKGGTSKALDSEYPHGQTAKQSPSSNTRNNELHPTNQ
jgi:hypothetical protein